MSDGWKKLKHPPVVLAVFEIQYKAGVDFDVTVLKRKDDKIKEIYPERIDNIKGNINLPSPAPGLSTAQISTQQVGYTYLNKETNSKIVITKDSFVFAIEGSYPGWDSFKLKGLSGVNYFSHIFDSSMVNRVSLRFINHIKIKSIESPLDYFNTLISAKEGVIEYPVDSYFHKYVMSVPNTNIKINVIQSLEEKQNNDFDFIFDIDVLCHDVFPFKLSELDKSLEIIRHHKNTIFFKNLTQKTISLL